MVCPKSYSVFTGASIGSKNGGISCNNKISQIQPARAIAEIKNGKLRRVLITDRGKNYDKAPKVKIIGDGSGAKVYSIVKNGEVKKILVKNGGINYKSTPKVIIDKPNVITYCNLCCRNEL